MGAALRAKHAREETTKAIKAADRAEAEAWSVRMEGYGGPAQPSPTIGQCLNGGLSWLEVECNRCKTRASIPLDCIRRPRDTPIWKLEASLKCRHCRKGSAAPPVHMIKLTEQGQISPYNGCTRARRIAKLAQTDGMSSSGATKTACSSISNCMDQFPTMSPPQARSRERRWCSGSAVHTTQMDN